MMHDISKCVYVRKLISHSRWFEPDSIGVRTKTKCLRMKFGLGFDVKIGIPQWYTNFHISVSIALIHFHFIYILRRWW